MQHIRYNTGRCYDYGTTQVLTIEVPDFKPEDLLDTVCVRFADATRNIRGVVQLFAFDLSSVGASVLREYDAGRYTDI